MATMYNSLKAFTLLNLNSIVEQHLKNTHLAYLHTYRILFIIFLYDFSN